MDQQELRRAVLAAMGGRSVRAFAAHLGLPKSTLHDYLIGRRDISPDPIYAALYRREPDLRRLLEQPEVLAALQGQACAVETNQEVADSASARRVTA